MAHQYPPQIQNAARRVVENEDVILLFNYHLEDLKTQITDSEAKDEILALHGEYTALRNFMESINLLGGNT